MATTLRRIEYLANGARDTTGAVVASGLARFYLVGTSTPTTVYSDDAASTAITQPLTLNAAGQGTVFVLGPVRMVVKDATDTTTIIDTPIANRADAVYLTNTSVNAGVETTEHDAWTEASSSFGSGFRYKESSTATARNFLDVIGDLGVSIEDFGAVGNDSTDCTTAIQAAIDRVEARGGGWVLVPSATYRFSGVTIDGQKVGILGMGPGAELKNTSTTGSAITVATTASADSKVVISNLTITHASTSSGSGILVSSGDSPTISGVRVGLHRTGINASAVAAAKVVDTFIVSTDDNAAAVGITVGTRGRVVNCDVNSSTDNGTGITLAGLAAAVGCYTNNFATGYSLATAGARATDCAANSPTTGFSLGASRTSATNCYVAGGTTGFSIAASTALCRVSDCGTDGTTTTDLSIGASATGVIEVDNTFTTFSQGASVTRGNGSLYMELQTTTSSSLSPSLTPAAPANGGATLAFFNLTGAGAKALTVNAPSGSPRDGQLIFLVVCNVGGGGAVTPTFASGSGGSYSSFDTANAVTSATISAGETKSYVLRYNLSALRWQALGSFIEV